MRRVTVDLSIPEIRSAEPCIAPRRRRVQDFLGVCPCDVSLPIGGRLRERRQYAGISRKALAQMFSVDEHTVSSWEESPTARNLEKLSYF